MAVSNMSFSPYQPSWFQMHRHSDQASMGDLEEKWVLLTVSDKKTSNIFLLVFGFSRRGFLIQRKGVRPGHHTCHLRRHTVWGRPRCGVSSFNLKVFNDGRVAFGKELF